MNKNYQYIIFNKPYGTLSQFTGEEHDSTLMNFNLPKDVYPVGRLDKDSEGLLLLTDDGVFNQKVANPKSNKTKTYWVQVENIPKLASLEKMTKGVEIQGYKTKPCEVKIIKLDIPPRNPPIRYRKNIPTTWLEITLSEGKNRQVRRMTAKIGHPTLRLIRVGIGKYQNHQLKPGQWIHIRPSDVL